MYASDVKFYKDIDANIQNDYVGIMYKFECTCSVSLDGCFVSTLSVNFVSFQKQVEIFLWNVYTKILSYPDADCVWYFSMRRSGVCCCYI